MDMLQIYKIYGIVLEENIASHKVLEKNSFNLKTCVLPQYRQKRKGETVCQS